MPSSNVCWGIEVGAGAVKALKLERDGEGVRVGDFVVIPHKKVLSTPDLDKVDATRVALGALMSQYRDAMKGASIAVSIPGHSSFARFAKLPPVEPKGVANLVRFEAVQQIPFPIDQVEWDHQTFANESSPDVEVGIFAVTKERIDEMLAMYGEVGLVPDIITLSPVAAYNAVAFDLSFTDKTPGTIILDIGTTATDLIVAEGGRVWIRTFPLGGHNFTEALGETFKLNYPKAEKLKREAETSKYKRHIFTSMKPVLTELIQDVQRSIAYYQDTHPEAQITRLVGVGSTFKLLGLRKLLSQQMRLEVFRLERFKRVSVEGPGGADFEAATPNLATAYGLALQGLGLNTIDANLMPVSVIRTALWKRKTPWFVAAAGLGLAAGGLTFLRPFLDSMSVARAEADREITGPIQETIRRGQQLKAAWTTVGQGEQPGMAAQNMIALAGGRELYPLLLEDLGSMFAAKSSTGGSGPAVTELVKFDASYVAPGGALASAAAGAASGDTGGGGGDDRDGGGSDAGDGGAEGAPAGAGGGVKVEATAGTNGAVDLTVVFDSSEESLAFINDSVLAWLRSNADRKERPYRFVNVPAATAVSRQPLAGGRAVASATGAGGAGSAAAPSGGAGGLRRGGLGGPRSGPGGAGGEGGGGGGGGGGDERGASTESPGAPGGAQGAGSKVGASTVESLAALPERVKPKPPSAALFRYTLRFQAQVKPAPVGGEAGGGEGGAESASAGGGEGGRS